MTEGLFLDEWGPSLDPEEKQNLCAEAAGLWAAEVRGCLRWEPWTVEEKKMVFGLGLPVDCDTIVST